MKSLYPVEMIKDVIDLYGDNIIVKVQQESNFQLAFTKNKVYDLDEIILLRRRDVGNAPSAVHVIEKNLFNNPSPSDVALILLAADEVLNRTELWEQETLEGAGGPTPDKNKGVSYKKYSHIKEVPNYTGRIMEILDPNSKINQSLNILNKLYQDIPSQIRARDGLIEINTVGDKTFFDILDIEDPDFVL